MHFATMVHHATRSRTKSVQFEKSVLSLNSVDDGSSREGTASPPVPGMRTSSLPPAGDNNKENVNVNTIRHHRSMLDVEDPPRLPVAQPLSYDELYPRPDETVTIQKLPPRRPFHSQRRMLPNRPATGLIYLLSSEQEANFVLMQPQPVFHFILLPLSGPRPFLRPSAAIHCRQARVIARMFRPLTLRF